LQTHGVGHLRAVPATLVVLAGVLALPAAASAATANVSGSTFTFSAAQGEVNNVIVETDGSIFRVIDNTAPVTAGAGCNQRSLHRVNCQNAGVTQVVVHARDQDDGVETLIGTTDATLNGGRGVDSLTSSDGDDTLDAGKGGGSFSSEFLAGFGGEDTLIGSSGLNASTSLTGGPGDDELLGGPGFDSLFGDLGADLLQGGSGPDSVFWAGTGPINVTVGTGGANDGEAGEGDEVAADIESISGTTFNDVLIGTAGEQNLFGGNGKDTLEGRGGADFLDGGDGADTLLGEGGEDQLRGGPRADDFTGGDGTDTADFGDHSTKVKVTIDNVANDGEGGGSEGDNVRTDIEILQGGSNDDTLIGGGQDDVILGREGDDDVQGGGGDDDLFGDSQFQSFQSGDDQLGGGDGDDRLFGGGGSDNFQGGADFDFTDYSQHAGSAALTITVDNVAGDGEAGEGDNVMDTVEGVIGANGNDTITGSPAANTLFGGGGADTLMGIGGRDLLDGETPGAFSGSFGPDVLNGGADTDTVSYRSHFSGVTVDIDGVADDGSGGVSEGDNVMTNVENLIGSSGFDTLTGSGAANTIFGGDGGDTIFGGAGGDHLTGGVGNDTHNGEAGKDEINSRDGFFSDTDNCGSEGDTAIVDAFDTVNPDCEAVIP
jgi:Ca2+-binding RTX toxin-like protein